jgi:hypothetical protein
MWEFLFKDKKYEEGLKRLIAEQAASVVKAYVLDADKSYILVVSDDVPENAMLEAFDQLDVKVKNIMVIRAHKVQLIEVE